MKKLISIFVIAVFLFSSCTPAAIIPEPTVTPTNTVVPSPTQTQIPTPTSTQTLIPTPTLSPDLNRYECAENVSREDCDFVKEGARLARYFFL